MHACRPPKPFVVREGEWVWRPQQGPLEQLIMLPAAGRAEVLRAVAAVCPQRIEKLREELRLLAEVRDV